MTRGTVWEGFQKLASEVIRSAIRESDVEFFESNIGELCMDIAEVYPKASVIDGMLKDRREFFSTHTVDQIAAALRIEPSSVRSEAVRRGWRIARPPRKKGAWKKYL